MSPWDPSVSTPLPGVTEAGGHTQLLHGHQFLIRAQQAFTHSGIHTPASNVSLQHFDYISNLEFLTPCSAMGSYTPTLKRTLK